MIKFVAERPRKYRSDQPAYRGWRAYNWPYFVRAFESSAPGRDRQWCAVAAIDQRDPNADPLTWLIWKFTVVIRVTPCRDEAHAIETAREFLARAVAEQLTADANAEVKS